MDFIAKKHKTRPGNGRIEDKSSKNRPKKVRKLPDYGLKSNSQENIEDRRLKNWRKWLKRREKMCDHLKFLTGRKSEDLLLNSYEKIRPKMAIKNLLEAATVEILSEKFQNDLNFWATPEFLMNRRCPELPEIATSVDKKLIKFPPNISRVFLPEISQQEKRLTIPASFPLDEKRNNYLLRKLKELAPQISKFNLKLQEIDQMAIVGSKIPKKQRVILKIDDEEIIFDKKIPSVSKMTDFAPLIFSLSFSSKENEFSERNICLDNETFLNIIYEWQEIVFDPLELEKVANPRSFHFAKSSDVILPGRREDLVIIYRPTQPGVNMESIRLDTDPAITESPIIFHLWGVCDRPMGLKDKLLSYEDYLDIRRRNAIIDEIIEDIWNRIESAPAPMPAYARYFLESEVFEAKNQYFYYYHEVVKELKTMYETITKKDPWALSIVELQAHVLNSDDETKKKFIELTQKLQKPRKIKFIRDDKYDAVYHILSCFVIALSDLSESTKSHLTQERRCLLKLESIQEDVPTYEDTLAEFESTRSLASEIDGKRKDLTICNSTAVSLDSGEFYGKLRGLPEDIYDVELYFEILFVRIYDLLGNTIDKICGAVESFNNLKCERNF